MPRITNWRRESRTPTLAYRNTETGARAVLHRAPDTYRYKWRGAILVDGYPIWSRGFETKAATTFRDVLRKKPTPELTCPECPNDDVVIGQKAADGATVQRWFDCPECGYEVDWWSPKPGEVWEPVKRGEFDDVEEPDSVSHLA